ncbi:hypothetical protein L596_019612 [Steinernema carpocapsae]|uniref:Uncharacterized protein n=1 Tax=Steinernema carpocapsae TaxID=34508 RepID=A0A4U5MRJ2_STECR|nr:hypothetical protein L596_019612 [Steinernema carpocapsae]
MNIELLQLEDGRVTKHKRISMAHDGTSSRHGNWHYEPKGSCAENEDHFCHRVDKILVWFDGEHPRLSEKFLVSFEANNATFKFEIPKPSPGNHKNWFGVWGERSEYWPCFYYLHYGVQPSKKRKESILPAYYLIGRASGVERLLSDRDHKAFIDGAKRETELRINCDFECPSVHKSFV